MDFIQDMAYLFKNKSGMRFYKTRNKYTIRIWRQKRKFRFSYLK